MTTWLRCNRRVYIALIAAVTVAGIAALLAVVALADAPPAAARVVAALGGTAIVIAVVLLATRMNRPRIACQDEKVLFFVTAGRPAEVPLEAIEAFFLGQGQPSVPGLPESDMYATYLIARLDQREQRWAGGQCDVRLAQWCDGYIRINGAWTEPLTIETVNRLNLLLHEAKCGRPAASAGREPRRETA